MKIRFWQKTYIFTLVIFLFFLNAGILSLAAYTYGKNVSAAEEAAITQQYYLASAFEREYDELSEEQKESDVRLLMQMYAEHYKVQGYHIEFYKGDELIYSNLSSPLEITESLVVHRYLFGQRYIIVADEICGGEYIFVFAKNVRELDAEYKALALICILISVGISLVLALILFCVLKKLSVPLDRLRSVTMKVREGDFSVRADEKGRDEFALLGESFNSMLVRICDQMQSLEAESEKKQMLVDNMAHELRTPLTSIYGYAEFLEKASSREEDRIIAARYIMTESKRLEKIAGVLLDEAYIRGNMPDMTLVDISELIKSVKNSLDYKAKQRGVDIRTELGEEKTLTEGNETLLSMLFYNLTENALKACSEGGEVVIGIEGKSVFVRDNGKGMTPEQLLHITEPFYRTDKSRARAEGGAGLGLYLCRRIARVHGANLEFDSAPGKGTKVCVNFTT